MNACQDGREIGSRIVCNGRRSTRRATLLGLVVLPAGLVLPGPGAPARAQAQAQAPAETQAPTQTQTQSPTQARPQGQSQPTPTNTVLIVGDSLSAEYGLRRGTGWVSQLAERLASDGIDFTGATGTTGAAGPAAVVNASISGETTAGGWSRYRALVERHRPAVVVIALGSNDALRGLDLASTETNLARMIDTAKAAGARPVLVGMMLPPNYGKAYADRFAALYADLAKRHEATLVPFLMAGFAEDLSKFQADRIHPNESAQPLMLANVWPALQGLAVKK